MRKLFACAMLCGGARQKAHQIILSIYCENLIIIFFLSFSLCFSFSLFCAAQMDKMSAYFFEIINKTITVGITDDLFSNTEKAQIIDDYSEWINKNNDEMATEYVICTCYMHFVPSLSITNTPNIRCMHAWARHCMRMTQRQQ